MNTMETTATTMTRGYAGRRLLAIAVMIGGMGLSACDDDPVEPHDHEEGDVTSFRLVEVGGGTLYTYNGPANPDTLFLPAGESIELEIVWLDEHGDEVELDADEHSWELSENHSAISVFTASTTVPWRGTITTTALVGGATVHGAVSVSLLHGADEEFSTPQIPTAVEG